MFYMATVHSMNLMYQPPLFFVQIALLINLIMHGCKRPDLKIIEQSYEHLTGRLGLNVSFG